MHRPHGFTVANERRTETTCSHHRPPLGTSQQTKDKPDPLSQPGFPILFSARTTADPKPDLKDRLLN